MAKKTTSSPLLSRFALLRALPAKLGGVLRAGWQRVLAFMSAKPFVSFFVVLGLLLVLIIVGSIWRKPTAATAEPTVEPTPVNMYSFDQQPSMTFSAKVEKSGVVTIVAQTGGIVRSISVKEGKHVSRGSTVVSLASNYQGGNTATVARQLAQKNYDATVNNYDLQKDIIGRQRDLAEKGTTQADELRNIAEQSLSDTRSLITLNEEIVAGIDKQITALNAMNVNGASDSAILAAKQGKAAALAGLNQLRAGLRSTEYQSSDDKTPAQMANVSKDLTLKQLDLQERGLGLAKDIAELNVKLARISEGMMYPAAPAAGVVERVFVKPGQSVNPGTPLATIKADKGENTAIVSVPAEIAWQVSLTEPSQFRVAGKTFTVLPRFVSGEAIDGSLHVVLYTLPREMDALLTNGAVIPVNITLGAKKIVGEALSIPLDAVYQTQDKSYVYVMEEQNGKQIAKIKTVELGGVTGSYVTVESGLGPHDVVVVSRTVQDGELIRAE